MLAAGRVEGRLYQLEEQAVGQNPWERPETNLKLATRLADHFLPFAHRLQVERIFVH